MITDAAERAGITKRVHPHLLRHACATCALRSGRMDVVTLQRVLGHADLSMILATYSHHAVGDLFEAQQRLHADDEL